MFDEDTPVAALRTIRPKVFVEGGDYAGVEIAEADALAMWGGRVVVLRPVAGRSTTRMSERAARHPARPPAAARSVPPPVSPARPA